MSSSSCRALDPGALFALRHVHDAQLAPKGSALAYVISSTVEGESTEKFSLVVADSPGSPGRTLEFKGDVESPRWSPSGKQLAFIGKTGDQSRLYVLNVAEWRLAPLTPESRCVVAPPAWSSDASTVAYAVMRSSVPVPPMSRISSRIFRSEGIGRVDGLSFHIELLDVGSGTVRRPELPMAVALSPSFSPCGRYLLLLGSETAVGYVSFGGLSAFTVDLTGGEVARLLGDRWFITAAAWCPSGERVVVAGDYGSSLTVPTAGLWVIDRDGSNPQQRTSGAVGNVGLRIHHDMPTWNTSQAKTFTVVDRGLAYATVMSHGCAEIWRIALEGALRAEPVLSGPRSCLIMDARSRPSQVLYAVTDLHQPWELHWMDLESSAGRQLTHLNDAALSGWPSLRLEHLAFESGDGLSLEGWYMARKERSGPQPTVLFIHGGPFLSTGHAFRFDFHLLAANGFAVVFANFRGSAGYGEAFVRAIMGDWGARGFPDHMATVDAAVARGLADQNRLGIWGASHGGFATAWAVGHTQRFRAAVAESAVTNFATLYYLSDAPDIFAHDLGGRPHEIPDVYRSRSPLSYASNCRTPTLLLQGTADVRCPMAEAEQFFRLLQDVGCVSELVQVEGMNHMGDATGPLAVRRAQNEALLDWFERYL